MPNINLSNHRLLLEYEEFARNNADGTVRDFLDRKVVEIDDAMKVELLGLDMEIRLKLGDQILLDRYRREYPGFADRISEIFSECVEDLVANFCPMTEFLGDLPRDLDGYTIHREIGRGGMGVVYEATQKSLDRAVAVKVLFFSREDISIEAKSLAANEHRNICKVYDTGYLGELPFMSMQLMTGNTLSHIINNAGPMKPEAAVAVMRKLIDAMIQAHNNGVVHFDLKPSNITIDDKGRPMIYDFGICRHNIDPENLDTAAHRGTPSYMAPELFSKEECSGNLCDIFSLGAVMFEMLTGRRAFHGPVEYVIEQILNDPPRRPSDYKPEIDHQLEAICLKALSKSPGSRFQSMSEFGHGLDEWRSSSKLDICGSVEFPPLDEPGAAGNNENSRDAVSMDGKMPGEDGAVAAGA